MGSLTGLEDSPAPTWAPDWDGDGVDELLVPLADGRDCLVALPDGGTVAAGTACYDGASAYAALPADGHDPGAVAFWGARVVQAGAPGDDAGAQGTSITDPGAADGSELGLAWAGDVDGDGVEDLYGAILSDAGAPEFGAVYLLLGPFDHARTTVDADAVVPGSRPWGVSPSLVRDAGDVDGDGHPELLQARPDGSVRFVSAPTGATPASVLAGGAASYVDSLNLAATDLDADGLADLVVPASYASILADADGALFVLRGPLTGTLAEEDADLVIRGNVAGQHLGFGWAGLGDWNGDGVPDLAASEAPVYGSRGADALLFFSLGE